LSYLKQIQRGVDYVEDNLDADIDCAEVARRAGLSQWHFQRIFKALTNETLKTYIRSRRFANALDALASTNTRIIEIALAAGYGRASRAPSRRPSGRPNVSLEPELYVQPAMDLVGMRTLFFSVDSEKNDVARKLPKLWAGFLPRLHEIEHAIAGVCYGIGRQTADETDELEYHAAIEVSRVDAVPPGMVRVHVLSARYARFTHAGRVAEIDKTVNYIYSSWLTRSRMRHTYAADIEFYDARDHPESNSSVIRYAIPVAPTP
jgi:AraC family transcriptional regulator